MLPLWTLFFSFFAIHALCEQQDLLRGMVTENEKGRSSSLGNNVFLNINDGEWTEFDFSTNSTWVAQSFIIRNDRIVIVQVTDILCAGDWLELYRDGVFVGEGKQGIADGCKTNITDPDTAYYSGYMSTISTTLQPGGYNLTIRVPYSPFEGGKGCIRILSAGRGNGGGTVTIPPSSTSSTTSSTTLTSSTTRSTRSTTSRSRTTTTTRSCPARTSRTRTHCPRPSCTDHHRHCPPRYPLPIPPVCSLRAGNLRVVTKRVSYGESRRVCEAIGGRLANITSYNFNAATKLLFDCAGASSGGWVASWNGDSYRPNDCLCLSTGSAAPGGSINVPASCHEFKAVICQMP